MSLKTNYHTWGDCSSCRDKEVCFPKYWWLRSKSEHEDCWYWKLWYPRNGWKLIPKTQHQEDRFREWAKAHKVDPNKWIMDVPVQVKQAHEPTDPSLKLVWAAISGNLFKDIPEEPD